MTRSDLEAILGDPADFIITSDNRHLVTKWAIAAGFPAVEVYSWSSVQLANLYHERAMRGKPTDLQRMAAEIVVQALQASSGMDTPALREYIRQTVEAVAPRRLEIVTQRGSVTLPGLTHYATPSVIRAVSRGDAVMMVGPAGCGKTTIGEHVATALQLPFFITNTINDTHELKGFVDGYGNYHSTPFRQAYEQGGLWIADEIDAWDASALLAANSALANGYSNFPDCQTPVRRHESFRMVATANTYGNGADRVYIGRNELDAASLDRFAMINVDYDLSLEQHFAGSNDRWLNRVWAVRKRVAEKRIRHVVSSRAISRGALALADGEEWDWVESVYLYKGMSEADRSKINV